MLSALLDIARLEGAPFNPTVRLIRCMIYSVTSNCSLNPLQHSAVFVSAYMMLSSGLIPTHNGFAVLFRTLSVMPYATLPKAKWWWVYSALRTNHAIFELECGILDPALQKNNGLNYSKSLSAVAIPHRGVSKGLAWA